MRLSQASRHPLRDPLRALSHSALFLSELWALLPLVVLPLETPTKRSLDLLVAQSSATGVTVAAIPPCSAIRFRNPKVPRYHPPARRAPRLLRMRGKCDRGGPEKGATP